MACMKGLIAVLFMSFLIFRPSGFARGAAGGYFLWSQEDVSGYTGDIWMQLRMPKLEVWNHS
jgi:hypothetical protein